MSPRPVVPPLGRGARFLFQPRLLRLQPLLQRRQLARHPTLHVTRVMIVTVTVILIVTEGGECFGSNGRESCKQLIHSIRREFFLLRQQRWSGCCCSDCGGCGIGVGLAFPLPPLFPHAPSLWRCGRRCCLGHSGLLLGRLEGLGGWLRVAVRVMMRVVRVVRVEGRRGWSGWGWRTLGTLTGMDADPVSPCERLLLFWRFCNPCVSHAVERGWEGRGGEERGVEW